MALPVTIAKQLDDALAKERRKVEQDEAAARSATSGLSGMWNRATGDGSASSLVALAAAERKLYEAHVTQAAKVRASGDLTKAGELLRAIGVELSDAYLQAEAGRLSLAGGVGEVAKASAKDAAQLAAETGQGFAAVLKASPFLIVAGLFLAGWFMLGRVAPRAS